MDINQTALPENEHWYTVQEVADFFRVNPRTIMRAIENGDLKAVKLGGWRIAPDDLKIFIENKKISAGSYHKTKSVNGKPAGNHKTDTSKVEVISAPFEREPDAVVGELPTADPEAEISADAEAATSTPETQIMPFNGDTDTLGREPATTNAEANIFSPEGETVAANAKADTSSVKAMAAPPEGETGTLDKETVTASAEFMISDPEAEISVGAEAGIAIPETQITFVKGETGTGEGELAITDGEAMILGPESETAAADTSNRVARTSSRKKIIGKNKGKK